MACSKMSKVIKGRSARNSESEVNSDRSVSLGRQGRLDYVNFGYLCSPHLSRCPKFTIAPLLLPRKGRAPYLVGFVAEIAIGLVRCFMRD